MQQPTLSLVNVPSITGLSDTTKARLLLFLTGQPFQMPVSGLNLQPLDSTLTALAAFNTNGILTQTAADTFVGRTITGTANKITVTNGGGASGDPTLTIPDAVTLVNPTVTGLLTISGDMIDEQGTWTPALNFGGASVGITYTTQTGRYTKFGRLVSIEGELLLSSKGSSVGNAGITGLPFTVGTSNGVLGFFMSAFTAITAGGGVVGTAGSSTLLPRQNNTTGSVTSTDTAFAATSRIFFGGTYSI